MNDEIDSMVEYLYSNEKDVFENEMKKDATWIAASREVYKYVNGADFNGTDEELAQAGLETMAKFNYQFSRGTVPMALELDDSTDDQKLAFMYMMEMYDNKDITGDGISRFFAHTFSDPTTYLGLGTLGWGYAAKKSASEATKMTVKAKLKDWFVRSYLTKVGGALNAEVGAYALGDDLARQEVEIQSGIRDEYDYGRALTAFTTGYAAAPVVQAGFNVGADVAGTALKEGARQIDKAAMGDYGQPVRMATGVQDFGAYQGENDE